MESLKEEPIIPTFQSGALAVSEPAPELAAFLPAEPSGFAKLKPGAAKKRAREVDEATRRYESELAAQKQRERERLAALDEAKRQHDELVTGIRAEAERRNRELDDFQARFDAGQPEAVVDYFSLVLDKSSYPSQFPKKFKMAFVPESKQLVVEYELPLAAVVPSAKGFKYVRARDAIEPSPRPATQSRALYASVVAQIAVRTLHEIFEADRGEKLETLVRNGVCRHHRSGNRPADRPSPSDGPGVGERRFWNLICAMLSPWRVLRVSTRACQKARRSWPLCGPCSIMLSRAPSSAR